MERHNRFLDELSVLLGPEGVLHDPADHERYVQDWAGDRLGMPLAVARPESTEQVAETVKLCRAHGVRMVPQGGHTGLVRGAMPDPEHAELVISLERMNRIRRIDPLNFSIAVDSGCILENVKRAAEAEDCYFPLSLGAQGSCQIGGNIATNAGGLNVLRYGMMRQLVMGLEVVLPDGRIWNGMRALHKDNRGYSLAQLFIGSEGTLGIVTGAVLKLSPRPEKTQTALLAVPSIKAAMQLYSLARRQCSDLLSAFELIPRECIELALEAAPQLRDPLDAAYPHYVLLDLAATGPVDLGEMIEALLTRGMENELVLDGALASSESQSQRLWQFRESMLEGQQRRGEHLRTDISVPISALADFAEAATQAVSMHAPEATIIAYGHVGDGNLHFNVLPPATLADEEKTALLHDIETLLFAVVDRFDGSISAEHGIGRVKQAAYLERISDMERELLSGLKRLFDPDQLMGMGRILPDPPSS
ncbi:FAD-binding oxidoreductase [Halomonas sp. McH1-25]|uniref:FAD-binding oxidoreductase n=1 Tax=unclassified Halomonas TaxID=2609666 RepID=UPI001EF4329D|nr:MULTISPECIES: FAD-binding oxidoreductase [unclassified Halomonas]MCG7600018.1 FAD-binding oxidoreductase [Halomonas sp. McH1-25]MCP1344113.1 FAD-binding oxidoreductase [Halomonas sp. FL8]MCP1362228.1 FAD-binding oxidoreductase [Halomonas sp. BBD45]